VTVPIPDPDNIPTLLELNARQDHAEHLRKVQPGITDREILDDWATLRVTDRAQRIIEARRRMFAAAVKVR
jgi:hypothetical protein